MEKRVTYSFTGSNAYGSAYRLVATLDAQGVVTTVAEPLGAMAYEVTVPKKWETLADEIITVAGL